MQEKKLTWSQTVQAIGKSLWFVIASSPVFLLVMAVDEIVGRLAPFASAWVIADLIGTLPRVAASTGSQHTAIRDIIALALIALVPAGFTVLTKLYSAKQRVELDLKIDRRLREAFSSLPFAMYEDKRVMDGYDRAQRFSRVLGDFVLDRLRSIFGALFTLAVAAVAFWRFSPLLAAAIFVLTIPALWIELRLQRMRGKLWRDNTLTYRKAYSHQALLEPRIIKESRLLGLVSFALEQAQRFTRKAEYARLAADRKTEKYRLASLVMSSFMETIVLLHALQRIITGALPFGQFVFVQQVTGQYIGALGSFSWLVESLDDLLFGIDEYTEITSAQPETAGKQLQDPTGDVAFNDVTFHYPGSGRAALKRVSLKISGGKTVAIVGENGAGKTTFVKLLMKLYEPGAGQVMVGGQALSQVSGRTWHQHIGVLFQDFHSFYDFTVRDSIWFGDVTKDRNSRDVESALRAADAEGFVRELPHGTDTYLGKYMDEENGTDLSGGQMQRLAIARTLFRNPDVLILDEPTSAIDAKAEYKIFQSIERARQGRTTILISHRFSTVRKADYIYVLSKGRLVEEGTHESLMTNNGLYHEMFTKQAEGYL